MVIDPILTGIGGTQVYAAIVEPIAVDMVGKHVLRKIKNHAMHIDRIGFGRIVFLASSPGVTGMTHERCAPCVLQDAFGIATVNDGDLALREEDESDTVWAHRVLLTLGAKPGAVSSGRPALLISQHYKPKSIIMPLFERIMGRSSTVMVFS